MATKTLMLRSNMVYFYSAYVIIFYKTFANLQKKESYPSRMRHVWVNHERIFSMFHVCVLSLQITLHTVERTGYTHSHSALIPCGWLHVLYTYYTLHMCES